MKIKICICFLLLTSCFLFTTCRPNLDIPEPSAGDADFSKHVAIGGNFMAGYQDGSLYADGQKYSIPALLAKQFELVGGGTFNQPMISDNSGLGMNSKPWESDFVTASLLRYKTDCEGVSALKPVKNLFNVASAGIYLQHQSGNFQNLSVPFAKVSDYKSVSLGNPGNTNPYYARFSSNPGISTMLGDVIANQPSFVSVWAGMEDVFDYARNGAYNQSILSTASFGLYLDSVLSGIPQGVIANIPDFTSFPFYTLVPWDGLELTLSKADSLNDLTGNIFNFVEGRNGFAIADPNSPFGYRKMVNGEYILLTVPLDSIKCNFLGVFTELPDRYVLDSTEVPFLNNAIAQYNSIIASKAQQYGFAFADMNAYFKTVKTGIKWNGQDINAEFVSGGFFSLDGYHPNQKGYALIANEFVRAINEKYNATIPWVNCAECSGVKFP